MPIRWYLVMQNACYDFRLLALAIIARAEAQGGFTIAVRPTVELLGSEPRKTGEIRPGPYDQTGN